MTRTIVHIDDDPSILDLVASSLTEPGSTEVVSVRDPDKAVETIGKLRPDLILCDINLPERDGFSLVEELRRWPVSINAPVIFVSGVSDEAQVERAFGIGAADFVRKPFRPSELKARVMARLGAHTATRATGGGMSPDVRGSLAMMSVGDLFNAVELGRKSGVLKLACSDISGEIRFRGGRIVAAQCSDGTAGEMAAYRLCIQTDGAFEMQFMPEAQIEGKIDLSPQFVLMEAFRLQDEGALSKPTAPSPAAPAHSPEIQSLLDVFDRAIAHSRKTAHPSVVRNYLEESRRILPRQWRESCQAGSRDGSLEGEPVIMLQPGTQGAESLLKAWISEFIKRGQYSEPKTFSRSSILDAGVTDAGLLDAIGIRN